MLMGMRYSSNKFALYFKKFVVITMVGILTIEPCFAAAGNSNKSPVLPNPARAEAELERLHAEMDPIWDDFINAKIERLDHVIDASDPALNQDPFFLRQQVWSDVQENSSRADQNESLLFYQGKSSLSLYTSGSNKVLNLKVPFIPIQTTDDYVFLSLSEESNLFTLANGGVKGLSGEGIFFISRQEMAAASNTGFAVPIYFIPIIGTGWQGKLDSLYIPESDMLVVANKTEIIPFELTDVTAIMKAQQINLMMATAITIANSESMPKSQVFPAPGSTAVFGLLFTGLDLNHPGKSLWRAENLKFGNLNFKEKFKALVKTLPGIRSINPFLGSLFPSAFADSISDGALNRIAYVGTALVFMMGVSMAIKYNFPIRALRRVEKAIPPLKGISAIAPDFGAIKDKLDKKYPSEQKIEIVGPLRPGEEEKRFLTEPIKDKPGMMDLGRENKKLFDVFAAVTTTAAQIPSVTTAMALELFLDRFAPTVTAADHTPIRRFLNNTFYFSRNQVKNVPVNHKTFILGAVVLNVVDTGFLVVQYKWAVPMISEKIADFSGPDMQARVNRTFAPDNADSNKIMVEDTARNGTGYLLSGSSSYSMEVMGLHLSRVTREVEDEMRRKGQDPFSPENQSHKAKQIEDKLAIVYRQNGLPEKKDFLFDYNTIVGKIPQMLGYKSDKAIAGIKGQTSYILARRYALTGNSLDKSIELAREWARTDNSNTAHQVLAILTETKESMSFFKNALRDGKAGIERARLARRRLSLLSYEGPVDMVLKHLPRTWSRDYSPQAAKVAGLFFRQSLYSYLSAEGDQMLFPSEEKIKRFSEIGDRIAFEEMRKENPSIASIATLTEEQAFEFKIRSQMAINNLARAEAEEKKAQEYQGPKMDWLALRKHKRALAAADKKMQEFSITEAGVSADPSVLQKMRMNFYRDALAKQIGLHIESAELAAAQNRPEYVKVLEIVERMAVESTQTELSDNLNMKTYHGKLSLEEKAKLEQYLYAKNFFQSYVEATVDLEALSPIDPAQPGRWQKVRQKESVRKSKFLTRLVRVFESPFSDIAVDIGVKGSLARSFPLGSDLVTSHTRTMKIFLGALTTGYLFSYFVWQMTLPYGSWIILIATMAATISTPSAWLMRASRMQGLKPKASVLSQIAYGIPYTWATFTGMIPIMLFSPDAQAFFNEYIRDPVVSLVSHINPKALAAAAVGLGVFWASNREKPREVVAGKSESATRLLNEAKKAGPGVFTCRALMGSL